MVSHRSTRLIQQYILIFLLAVGGKATAQSWASYEADICTSDNRRTWKAHHYAPVFSNWMDSCENTKGNPNNIHPWRKPNYCINKGLLGVEGVWVIEDSDCDVTLNTSGVSVDGFIEEQPVWGMADTHAHLFSQLGFGKKFFHGDTFHRHGAHKALESCADNHAIDILGTFAAGETHTVGGFPELESWPKWDAITHQQAYWQWLKRAYQGGLRLMVSLAVTNEHICKHSNHEGSCYEMHSVDEQLAAAYGLEEYIRDNDGGWLQIAESSAEARDIINQGKFALVLGIEVDSLFGCYEAGASCSEGKLLHDLDRYYDLGARHFFPVHLYDNQFGGAALYNSLIFGTANFFATGEVFDTENCTDDGYEYQDHIDLSGNAHCNQKGLTETGRFLIQAMMKRGLVIDVDHMSRKMLDATLTLAEAYDYPLVAGHTGFTELSIGSKNAESQKSPEQLCRIKKLNGLVAPILQQGKISETKTYIRSANPNILDDCGQCSSGNCKLIDGIDASIPVRNSCSASSRSFAQAYLYAVDAMRPANDNVVDSIHAVPFGSDVNGLVDLPAPRFGGDACGGEQSSETHPITYPFTPHGGIGQFYQQESGEHRYNYNFEGMAHIGLLPDFVEDLKRVGVSDEDLEPLFNSAEAYLRLWEKAERAVTLPAFGASTDSGQWNENHIREMADLNGDGIKDIIGFGQSAVYTSLGKDDGTFEPAKNVYSSFTYDRGWRVDQHLRLMADVNGDGWDDLVAFWSDEVYTLIAKGDGTVSIHQQATEQFTFSSGWRTDKHSRLMADVNGDGRADIVGFYEDGVYTALAKSDNTFEEAIKASDSFGYYRGWRVSDHVRLVNDVNNDGMADIVGFGETGMYTALSNGDGTFAPAFQGSASFGNNRGWRNDRHIRDIQDVNGDSYADIVAAYDDSVYFAYGNGDGTFQSPTRIVNQFAYDQGWRHGDHLRFFADINNDGLSDVIGTANAGLYVAITQADGQLSTIKLITENFGVNQGWQVETHPRKITTLNNKVYIVGFGEQGVKTYAINRWN